MICQHCQEWMTPTRTMAPPSLDCSLCGGRQVHTFLPLFIITGPSGTGKTAIVQPLRRLLPDWHIFETDILWDSAGDWNTVFQNWLRIAVHLAQHPQPTPTILCGTWLPDRLTTTTEHYLLASIHWLALVCDPNTLADRLRHRPVWRGWNDRTIAEQVQFAAWLHQHTHDAFEPPLTLVDTSTTDINETARQIYEWVIAIWPSTPTFDG